MGAVTTRPSTLLSQRQAEILEIASRHHALAVSVFGSVARDEDAPGSDLDLLVRFAPGASLFDQASLEQELEDALGVNVDVTSEGGLRAGHDKIRAEARPL